MSCPCRSASESRQSRRFGDFEFQPRGRQSRLGQRPAHAVSERVELAGGEQQRVCIARALINHPPILLADEPTGNLDAANQAIVAELLQDLHRNGHTIVMVTHDPEMAGLAQRKIALSHGKVFCHPVGAPMVTLRRRDDPR